MRIAVLSFYSGTFDRGVETWVENLKANSGKDFSINIISDKGHVPISMNWFIHRIALLKHVFISFSQWSGADIIVPTNGTFQTLVCRIVSWIYKKRMVVFGHSGPGADDKWNLLCSPDIFVGFSANQSKWANRFKLPWTKVVTIPHAVDTSLFQPDKTTKKRVDVLCVAANSPDKRVDAVIGAMKLLPQRVLQVVGSGQPEQVPFTSMPKLYNQARAFCFVPKSHEAFGLVYLEAMACNLPVVAVADAVRQEIVGDAGILVSNPEDPSSLAQAIKTALNSEWGTRPRQQAENFSWKKVIGLYSNLWLSLLK